MFRNMSHAIPHCKFLGWSHCKFLPQISGIQKKDILMLLFTVFIWTTLNSAEAVAVVLSCAFI